MKQVVTTHLTVPGGEDGSQDLPVLLHLVKLLLQRTLHMGVGQHVFDYVLLQGSPQRSLVGAVKLESGENKNEIPGNGPIKRSVLLT